MKTSNITSTSTVIPAAAISEDADDEEHSLARVGEIENG